MKTPVLKFREGDFVMWRGTVRTVVGWKDGQYELSTKGRIKVFAYERNLELLSRPRPHTTAAARRARGEQV